MSKPPVDEQAVQRLFEWITQAFLVPEMRRRIEQGRLPDDFKLRAVQVIFGPEGGVPEVRLNEEVRGVVRRRTSREIAKDDVVFGDESIDVPEILLTDADPNAAHVTAIASGDGGWLLSYDTRYNARRAAEQGAAAREFLEAAGFSLARDNVRAFADALFSASELMAKTYLVTLTGPKKRIGHGTVAADFNVQRKAGNVNERFAQLFNRLSNLRSSARYLNADFTLDPADAAAMMATADEMFRALYDVVPKRHAAGR